MDSEETLEGTAVQKRPKSVSVVYFLFMAGVGSLLPYIPVFMKHLGLTALETGIMYGVMPFISFFIRPLIETLADKTRSHKIVLTICTLLTGVLYATLLLTPRNLARTVPTTATLHCSDKYTDTFLQDCNRTGIRYYPGQECPGVENLELFIREVRKPNMDMLPCKLQCHEYFMETEYKKETLNARAYVQLQPELVSPSLVSDILVPTCYIYRFHNLTFDNLLPNQTFCETLSFFECEVTCNNVKFKKSCGYDTFGRTFWTYFLIFLFGSICFSPAKNLVDVISNALLDKTMINLRCEKLWGTAGLALFALASGIAISSISAKENLYYFPAFILFLGLACLACIVTFFLKLPDGVYCEKVLKSVLPVMKSFRMCAFQILVTSCGIMQAAIEIFLGWYIVSLGGNTVTIGMCIVANCIPEIIIFKFSGGIIKKIGHVACFCIGLSTFTCRFFAYTFIENAWFIIPLELSHCLSYALTYIGALTYAGVIFPEGTSETMNGLVVGLYLGFGKGIGSLVTGALFDDGTGFGPRWTFKAFGFFALVLLVVYSLLHVLMWKANSLKLLVDPTCSSSQEHEQSDDKSDGNVVLLTAKALPDAGK